MDPSFWSAVGTTAGGLIGFWLASKYDWVNKPISEVLASRKARKLAAKQAKLGGKQGITPAGHGGVEKPLP